MVIACLGFVTVMRNAISRLTSIVDLVSEEERVRKSKLRVKLAAKVRERVT